MLLTIHSVLRYAAVLAILWMTIRSLSGWMGNRPFSDGDKRWTIIAMSVFHLQFLVGIVVYLMSPIVQSGLADMKAAMKSDQLRFWTVEHPTLMLLVAVLVTVANVRRKKAKTARSKYKQMAIIYIVAIIILYFAIPWPFGTVQRPWF